jgi:hypothetical protein
VAALNIYGSSTISLSGNGAIITTSPNPSNNLAEDTLQRTATNIGLTWTAPNFAGGDIIIDY